MEVKAIYKSITELTGTYKQHLAGFTANQFISRPAEDRWSPSEVYHHIFDSSILSLKGIRAIALGRGVEGSPSAEGELILQKGAFPPEARIKAPEFLEIRVKAINIDEAAALIKTFEDLLEMVYPTAGQLDQNLTVKHPLMGFFNAAQWLRITEIHLAHHLMQLERIKAMPALIPG